jgi:hypothetical protein
MMQVRQDRATPAAQDEEDEIAEDRAECAQQRLGRMGDQPAGGFQEKKLHSIQVMAWSAGSRQSPASGTMEWPEPNAGGWTAKEPDEPEFRGAPEDPSRPGFRFRWLEIFRRRDLAFDFPRENHGS